MNDIQKDAVAQEKFVSNTISFEDISNQEAVEEEEDTDFHKKFVQKLKAGNQKELLLNDDDESDKFLQQKTEELYMTQADKDAEKEKKREAKKELKFYDENHQETAEKINKNLYIESKEITKMTE